MTASASIHLRLGRRPIPRRLRAPAERDPSCCAGAACGGGIWRATALQIFRLFDFSTLDALFSVRQASSTLVLITSSVIMAFRAADVSRPVALQRRSAPPQLPRSRSAAAAHHRHRRCYCSYFLRFHLRYHVLVFRHVLALDLASQRQWQLARIRESK